jgi:hypothetical protein
MTMPDPRFFSRVVVFGLLWLLVLVVEGAVLKLVLFGLDGASWPLAFLVAFGVNLASSLAGGLAGVHFDFWAFEFTPGPLAVLGISLGVEGGILLAAFGRWRLRRALVTAVAMNAASYLLLVLARLPGEA